MKIKSLSPAERLEIYRVAIENTIADPEVLPETERYGYGLERMNQLKVVLSNAQEAQQGQRANYGDQKAATQIVNLKRKIADDELDRLTTVAERAFKNDPGLLHVLGVNNRPASRKIGVWHSYSVQFYTQALNRDELKAGFARFNVTEETLQNGLQLVNDALAAWNDREQKRGRAQQGTKERDEAIRKIDNEMDDFLPMATLALKDKPQLRERLGLIES